MRGTVTEGIPAQAIIVRSNQPRLPAAADPLPASLSAAHIACENPCRQAVDTLEVLVLLIFIHRGVVTTLLPIAAQRVSRSSSPS